MMKASWMLSRFICSTLAPILAVCMLIAGCRTVPVVPHAVACDASAELLASKCPPPRPLADNATFAELVDTMQADRQALRECGVTVEALIRTIRQCNLATDEYNRKIDAVNNAN